MDLQEAWEAFTDAFQEEIDGLNESGDEQDKALAKIAEAIMNKAEEGGLADLVDALQYESESALQLVKRWGYA